MKNNIGKILHQRDETQQQLAFKIGVKREYINRIIHEGVKIPRINLAIKIARALNTTVEKIWGDFVE